ncbi:MAG: hypothetical protein AB1916_15820 [Thermodesulfobacteriota bacterium]
MHRLFSFLLDRRVSLVGFGMVMMPIQLASILRTDLAAEDGRRLLAAALYCLLWVLIYRALRGSRLASAGVGAYMALQGLLYVLMLLGNLMSMLTGSLEQATAFLMGVALGPWFLVAGGGLMGQAWISYRSRQALPDAARVEFSE